jgi:excisionase family DNA binding protein
VRQAERKAGKRSVLQETSNRESGNRVEKVLAAAILEKLENLVEDAARSREVMDTKEAAEFLRLSPSEFRKLAATGVIPRHPLNGKSYRYLRGELLEWLRRRL